MQNILGRRPTDVRHPDLCHERRHSHGLNMSLIVIVPESREPNGDSVPMIVQPLHISHFLKGFNMQIADIPHQHAKYEQKAVVARGEGPGPELVARVLTGLHRKV